MSNNQNKWMEAFIGVEFCSNLFPWVNEHFDLFDVISCVLLLFSSMYVILLPKLLAQVYWSTGCFLEVICDKQIVYKMHINMLNLISRLHAWRLRSNCSTFDIGVSWALLFRMKWRSSNYFIPCERTFPILWCTVVLNTVVVYL